MRTYELADKYHLRIEGAVTWAFEFENQPYFAGPRELATNGVDKPVLNVFRMMGMLSSAKPGGLCRGRPSWLCCLGCKRDERFMLFISANISPPVWFDSRAWLAAFSR